MSRPKCTKCGHLDEASATLCTKCGTLYPVSDSARDASSIRKGQVIANRYVVLEMIGRGGMGQIYKVQDNTLGEIVALKTLLPEYVKEKLVVERFFNEARIARGLSHPHIVRVHDIGSTDGMVYISMELLHGRTLRSMLDKVKPEKRIPLNAILRMFDALCAALDYAHQYTIHRDIKPENVMVLPDGTVKLMDFGISKLMSNPNLTSASMVMGTPHYMSPEQFKNSANVDARADIYSVGIMLYEVLTGDIPSAVTRSDNVQKVPRALDRVIAKCCHRDPAKRYKNIAELRDQLRKIRVQVETGSGKNGESAPNSGKSRQGGPSLRRIVASLAVIGIGIGAYFAMLAAEGYRHDILARVPESPRSSTGIAAPEASARSSADTYSAMKPIIESAKKLAQAKLSDMENGPHYDHAAWLIEEANVRWESMTESGGLASGWPVLHRYLAVLKWPAGMTFVPGGNVTAPINGRTETYTARAFLIDTNHVTASAFNAFCIKNKWRIPNGMNPGEYPARNVTYYDALAFLYSESTPKQLPTTAQWMLAVESTNQNPQDNDGKNNDNIQPASPLFWPGYEWLRAEVLQDSVDNQFGQKIPTINPSSDQQGNAAAELEYMALEEFSPNLGFRGVLEFPTTLKEARIWLD